jgi:hypothetical protein
VTTVIAVKNILKIYNAIMIILLINLEVGHAIIVIRVWGRFEDKIKNLEQAIEYIRRTGEE